MSRPHATPVEHTDTGAQRHRRYRRSPLLSTGGTDATSCADRPPVVNRGLLLSRACAEVNSTHTTAAGKFRDHPALNGSAESVTIPTHRDLLEAIRPSDWHPGDDGLRWAAHAPDDAATERIPGDVSPTTIDWHADACRFTIQCTRCHRMLETGCGEAHFPSAHAAADAAVAARWLVSAHRVWCRSCTALVDPATSPPVRRAASGCPP